MKKKLITLLIGFMLIILLRFSTGIHNDTEFSEYYLFIKPRLTWQFCFNTTVRQEDLYEHLSLEEKKEADRYNYFVTNRPFLPSMGLPEFLAYGCVSD